MKAIILEEAYRSITVNDAKGPVSIPMAQAILRSLAFNAAKGNQRAQRLFTELLGTTERDNRRLHDEWMQTAIEYKVEWERELERRKKLGITGPDPLPIRIMSSSTCIAALPTSGDRRQRRRRPSWSAGSA